MPDIFISYSRKDILIAKTLAEKLADNGWIIWWDHQIPAGKDYDQVIEDNLNSSKCVIVIWTINSILSRNVKDEAHEALAQDKLIPIVIGDIRPPLGFRMLQNLRLDENSYHEIFQLNQIVENVISMIGKPFLKDNTSNSNLNRNNDNSKERFNIEKIDKDLETKIDKLKEKADDTIPDLDKLMKILTSNSIKRKNFYVSPSIPFRKAKNAKIACWIPDEEPLIGVVDLTVWGSASDCFVFTPFKMYYKWMDDAFTISYTELLQEIKLTGTSILDYRIWINNKKLALTYKPKELIKIFNEIRDLLKKD